MIEPMTAAATSSPMLANSRVESFMSDGARRAW
jgi:hypothetical protein